MYLFTGHTPRQRPLKVRWLAANCLGMYTGMEPCTPAWSCVLKPPKTEPTGNTAPHYGLTPANLDVTVAAEATPPQNDG